MPPVNIYGKAIPVVNKAPRNRTPKGRPAPAQRTKKKHKKRKKVYGPTLTNSMQGLQPPTFVVDPYDIRTAARRNPNFYSAKRAGETLQSLGYPTKGNAKFDFDEYNERNAINLPKEHSILGFEFDSEDVISALKMEPLRDLVTGGPGELKRGTVAAGKDIANIAKGLPAGITYLATHNLKDTVGHIADFYYDNYIDPILKGDFNRLRDNIGKAPISSFLDFWGGAGIVAKTAKLGKAAKIGLREGSNISEVASITRGTYKQRPKRTIRYTDHEGIERSTDITSSINPVTASIQKAYDHISSSLENVPIVGIKARVEKDIRKTSDRAARRLDHDVVQFVQAVHFVQGKLKKEIKDISRGLRTEISANTLKRVHPTHKDYADNIELIRKENPARAEKIEKRAVLINTLERVEKQTMPVEEFINLGEDLGFRVGDMPTSIIDWKQDMANLFSRAGSVAFIYGTLHYLPSQWMANMLMAGISQGVFFVNNARWVTQLALTDRALFEKIRKEIGHGPTASLAVEQAHSYFGKAAAAPAEIMGTVADDVWRMTAWIHAAKKNGYRTPKQWNDLLSGVPHGHFTRDKSGAKLVPDSLSSQQKSKIRKLNQIKDDVNSIMVGFEKLNGPERILARFIFIYPWLKGGSIYPFAFAGERPVTAAAIGAVSNSLDEPSDYLDVPGMPYYYDQLVAAGPQEGKYQDVYNYKNISFASTPIDFGEQLIRGLTGKTSLVDELANPAVETMVKFLTGDFSNIAEVWNRAPSVQAIMEDEQYTQDRFGDTSFIDRYVSRGRLPGHPLTLNVQYYRENEADFQDRERRKGLSISERLTEDYQEHYDEYRTKAESLGIDIPERIETYWDTIHPEIQIRKDTFKEAQSDKLRKKIDRSDLYNLKIDTRMVFSVMRDKMPDLWELHGEVLEQSYLDLKDNISALRQINKYARDLMGYQDALDFQRFLTTSYESTG